MAVLIFQSCGSGDDRNAGEMSFRPTAFLRLGPLSSRKPGQDDGIEMPHGLVQVHRIGQQIQFGEEVWHGYKLAPELLKAELLLKLARRLPKTAVAALSKSASTPSQSRKTRAMENCTRS